ncbi:MAG: hypothetical protein AAGC72_05890 [Planctomycetota bacterium]
MTSRNIIPKSLSRLSVICIAMVTSHLVDAEPRASDHSLFQNLFADKISDVQKTRDTSDDADLIEEMRVAAEQIPDSPEVQRLIYRSMIDLGISAREYVLAVSGIDLLRNQFPDDPAANPAIALDLLEKGYRKSRRQQRKEVGELYLDRLLDKIATMVDDEKLDDAAKEYRKARLIARDLGSPLFESIQQAIDRIDRQIQTEARVQELTKVLAANQSNKAAAQELTLLLMVVKKRPSEALSHVGKTGNQALIKVVELAAKERSAVSPDDAVVVAEWYSQQGESSSYGEDILMHVYTMVVDYCDIYLEKSAQRDAKRLRVIELRTDALNRLERYKPATDVAGGWKDLLEEFDTKRYGLGDQIQLKDGKLGVNESDFILNISPEGGYELKIQYSFVEGEAGMNFCLPISGQQFTLAFSRARHTQTILWGVGSRKEERFLLKPGQTGSLFIRVKPEKGRDASVVFKVNNSTAFEWKGPLAQLELNVDYVTPKRFDQAIRISCGGTYVFNKIEFRELDVQ